MGLPAAAAAPLVLGAVSTAAATFGAWQQASAARAQAEYQGKVAEQNRALALRQAQEIEAEGGQQEDRYRQRLAQLLGAQRTQIAATGVDLGSGSALDLLGDVSALGELDVRELRRGTAREAYAARIGAHGARSQAGLFRSEAAGISPAFSSGVTLLGGASTLADRWNSYSSRRKAG